MKGGDRARLRLLLLAMLGLARPAWGDQPQFVYEGSDTTGTQLYDVTWATRGSQPFAVRVLIPTHPSSDYPHSFLFALPVEHDLTQSLFGSGLDELGKLDVEDRYNTTIIEPIFPKDSWYADNPDDPTIDYETFTALILPQWVHKHFSLSGNEKNRLLGFSKSGYGAIDLLLKHPNTFDAAAAFDFPADMRSYDGHGASASANYGTQANFSRNYELTGAFIHNLKASFTAQDRILISEGPVFASQVADFSALLTFQGLAHTLLIQRNYAHNWSGGWLPDVVAGLFGPEQKSNGVPSTTMLHTPRRTMSAFSIGIVLAGFAWAAVQWWR